jgi:tetratricopeptide (TPR) repeat protein
MDKGTERVITRVVGWEALSEAMKHETTRMPLLSLLLAAALLGGACDDKKEVDPAERHAQLMTQLENAEVRLRNNKLSDAEEIITRVLGELPEDPRALTDMGRLRFQQGKHKEAEEFLDKSIAAKGDEPEAHFLRGQVLKHTERWAEAAASFQKAFELAPDRSEFGLQAGESLNKAEKYAEAEAVLQQVADLDPQSFDENNVGVHTHLADALRGQNKLDEALKMYMKAQNTWDSDKMARAGAAFVYEAKNDPAHAIAEWSAYIQRDAFSEYSKTVAQKKIMELKVPPTEIPEEGKAPEG